MRRLVPLLVLTSAALLASGGLTAPHGDAVAAQEGQERVAVYEMFGRET